MRKIEVEMFYSKDIQNQIEVFNQQADILDTERGQIESELAMLKTCALSGDIDGLAGLGKKRDQLKGKLLACLVASVKLAEGKGRLQKPIEAAYLAERVKRQEALTKRGEEVEAIFKKHGLAMRLFNGVQTETCAPLKIAVSEVANIPKIEDDSDRALIAALRNKIAGLLD